MYSLLWLHFYISLQLLVLPCHVQKVIIKAILWRGCKFVGKNSYFPLPLDVRRCVAPTGEEVDARQRGVN